ncbi:hypothetical protein ACLOJK_028594, partial [Asimina triloba]
MAAGDGSSSKHLIRRSDPVKRMVAPIFPRFDELCRCWLPSSRPSSGQRCPSSSLSEVIVFRRASRSDGHLRLLIGHGNRAEQRDDRSTANRENPKFKNLARSSSKRPWHRDHR